MESGGSRSNEKTSGRKAVLKNSCIDNKSNKTVEVGNGEGFDRSPRK
jgi:hypothetical protein